MSSQKLDLSPLLTYLVDCHEGDLLSLIQSLSKTIFMLHFVPMDTFSDLERQNVCHVLMELKEAVTQVYLTSEKAP
ncbi:hypothetical protein M3P19_05125 [Muricauda sp. 2012CJ35-5]|uniref:Uncharacterized protein n=1 Tax=Flagellimonas spongiicola TaxID=2942208 RepID=A0ABT0PPR0_9FLAO|nr:hypothetical protein [Allomuricauda spongiicola]MCL6273380.1 hypothetical protein [Allomuricauda spongiicola]